MAQTPALLKRQSPADLSDPFERAWAESEAARRPGAELTKGMARVWYEKGLEDADCEPDHPASPYIGEVGDLKILSQDVYEGMGFGKSEYPK